MFDEGHAPARDFLSPNVELLMHGWEALPTAVAAGCYVDASSWCRVMRTLLTRDFYFPVKEAIEAVRVGGRSLIKGGYEEMYLRGLSIFGKGIVYMVSFKCSGSTVRDWSTATQLCEGNLLALTGDLFNSILWGTVAVRRKEDLERGIIGLTFNTEDECRLRAVLSRGASAFEVPSFFREHMPVLERLSDLEAVPSALPFRSELVSLSPGASPLVGRSLDASAIYPTEEKDQGRFDEPKKVTSSPVPLRVGAIEVNHDWPSEGCQLDPTQLDAVHHALSHRLALIQGPPGTGKSHVGLKLAEILTSAYKGPILVIAKGNHQLDGFMEACLPFTKKIVRMGRGSESETLSEYSLDSIIRARNSDQKTKKGVFLRTGAAQRKEMETMQKEIERMMNESEARKGSCALLDALNGASDAEALLLDALPGAGEDSIKKWAGLDESGEVRLGPKDMSDLSEALESAREMTPLTVECDGWELAASEKQLSMGIDDGGEVPDSWDCESDASDAIPDCWDASDTEEDVSREDSQKIATEIGDVIADNSFREAEWIEPEEDHVPVELDCVMERGAMLKEKLEEALKSEIRLLPSPREVLLLGDLNLLKPGARRALLYAWGGRDHNVALKKLIKLYTALSDDCEALWRHQKLLALQEAEILGVTVAATGMNAELLKALKPQCAVVEEAAEVLEGQLVAGLPSSLEHLILIGDHCQLRPQIQCHMLGIKKNLSVSLFERLALGGYPHIVLGTQCRQSPELSKLIMPIYPHLKDHPSVYGRSAVPGMSHRLIWLSHRHSEKRDGFSVSNPEEASMVVALAAYLIEAGNSPRDITVLATYIGQKRLIERVGLPRGVECHTVDRYQGDENQVVILSLVRSNTKKDVGFLRARSRSCVMLSRARRGLIVVGDSELMSTSGGAYWKDVLGMVKKIAAFREAHGVGSDVRGLLGR